MHSCNNTYTVTEYGGFTRGKASYGYRALPEKTFDALEAFILANNTDKGTEAIELLSLSARRGVGKVITARNYVGVITMADGTVIEILPKIVEGEITESDTKRIFLEMLKTLKDVAFKDFNVSNLHTDIVSKTDIRYASDDNVKVHVAFVDLMNADGSISKILEEVCKCHLLSSGRTSRK